MSHNKPRIAVTTGDCAGIGTELVLHSLHSDQIKASADLTIYGSRKILERVSRHCGIAIPGDLAIINSPAELEPEATGNTLVDIETSGLSEIVPSKPQSACGAAAAKWIECAVADTLAGKSQALVTAPINKASFNMAGIKYPGHTEMLAALCGASSAPCMSFFTPGLIVSLATIHTALSTVPSLLEKGKLVRVARLTCEACIRQGIKEPGIGMLALNPHAGENGLFGREEEDIIIPAIEEARKGGINITGPLVPDTAFTWLYPPKKPPPFDAYIAMYHDQALIPFKMAAFDMGVNVTLGLPIVRTSPDHGTAFDLAWQGKASPNSFFEAIKLAARMVESKESP